MNSKKLKQMCKDKSGTLKAFAQEIDVPYTTLHTSLSTDRKVDSMPVSMFIKVAEHLEYAVIDLAEELDYEG